MLAKVASKSFDAIEIQCDGEGALGALSGALQASGVRVAIAGPGQHVAVVEHMVGPSRAVICATSWLSLSLVTRETLKRPFKRLNGQFGALKRLNV